MLIIAGASASGKTVTALNLEKRYGFSKAVTTTTRPMRTGEKHGKDYFFLSKEEFFEKIKNDEFVEYSLYNNNYYGCGKDQVANNKVIVLDPNGIKSFQKLNDKNIVSVLLVASQKTRESRMNERGDNKEKITERLVNDAQSFSINNFKNIDLIIETDDLSIDQVCDKINTFYRTHIN